MNVCELSILTVSHTHAYTYYIPYILYENLLLAYVYCDILVSHDMLMIFDKCLVDHPDGLHTLTIPTQMYISIHIVCTQSVFSSFYCSFRIAGPDQLSGFGFELTFRLICRENSPPLWPAELLQSLARYVFQVHL